MAAPSPTVGVAEPTAVQLQILRQRFPHIGEPAIKRNWAVLLAGHILKPDENHQPAKERDAWLRPVAPPAKKLLPAKPLPRLPVFFSALGVPAPVPEYRFAPPRRWRFDFAWPDFKIALEVDGGVFTGGRHTRGVGFLNDCEKLNEAVCLGWRVVRVTPDEMSTMKAVDLILRLMAAPPCNRKIYP